MDLLIKSCILTINDITAMSVLNDDWFDTKLFFSLKICLMVKFCCSILLLKLILHIILFYYVHDENVIFGCVCVIYFYLYLYSFHFIYFLPYAKFRFFSTTIVSIHYQSFHSNVPFFSSFEIFYSISFGVKILTSFFLLLLLFFKRRCGSLKKIHASK